MSEDIEACRAYFAKATRADFLKLARDRPAYARRMVKTAVDGGFYKGNNRLLDIHIAIVNYRAPLGKALNLMRKKLKGLRNRHFNDSVVDETFERAKKLLHLYLTTPYAASGSRKKEAGVAAAIFHMANILYRHELGDSFYPAMATQTEYPFIAECYIAKVIGVSENLFPPYRSDVEKAILKYYHDEKMDFDEYYESPKYSLVVGWFGFRSKKKLQEAYGILHGLCREHDALMEKPCTDRLGP